MTDHTTAAQATKQEPVLTDANIRAITESFGGGLLGPIQFARAIESALLSKLRAPVADERDRNATISQVVGLCNRIPGSTTWNAAQFMYDEMHRRAALASAPVAGEAQPVAWMLARRLMNSDPKFTFADPADVYESVYVPLYAAPQASEAVAAEALEVAREALMEIADLADVDADERSVIVNQALTKIDRITALAAQPGAQKKGGSDAK